MTVLCSMTVNSHGPFSVRELRTIAADSAEAGVPRLEDTAIASIPRPEDPRTQLQFRDALSDVLADGRPLVCLWSEGADKVGHYIALVPRGAHFRNLEVFDPESSGLEYITGDGAREEASRYNADVAEILKMALDKIDNRLRGAGHRGELSFCPWGPQPPRTSSCGLHCLLRVAHRDMSPEAYVKLMRKRVLG